MRVRTAAALVTLLASCGKPTPELPVEPGAKSASPSDAEVIAKATDRTLAALHDGRVRELTQLSNDALASGATDSTVQVAKAFGGYHDGVTHFLDEMSALLDLLGSGLDHARGRRAFTELEAAMTVVDQHLARAAEDREFALELCLACWEVNWNRRGEVDEFDRLLFQIEYDAEGQPIPEADPRRKPTFRFDHGDLHWARAMVAFQRGLVNLLLAYDWHELDRLWGKASVERITLRVENDDRIAQARQRFLEGLEYSDLARRAYLAETDDDREWMPAPKQRNHPMPLPVDEALYATWEGSVRDLIALVEGREGLSIAELAQLGDHQWEQPPGGFIDIGGMLAEPGNIVIPIEGLFTVELTQRTSVEKMLTEVFGGAYRPKMTPSPLVKRLQRMKGEVDRGDETVWRKLRYLFWVN